jgi:DNA-binding MarR family transcriptional regulator
MGTMRSRVRAEYERCRKRASVYGAALGTEPGWNFLLDLYLSEVDGRSLSVTDLSFGSEVPTSTTLRWLSHLEGHDLLWRAPDPADKRRVHVHLTLRGKAVVEAVCGPSDQAKADGTVTVKISQARSRTSASFLQKIIADS